MIYQREHYYKNTPAVWCITVTKTLVSHLCWIRPVPSLYCLTVSLWSMCYMPGRKQEYLKWLVLSLSASQNTRTDVNTQNLFFWVRGRLWIHSHMCCDWKNIKNKCVRTGCECSHGPDKACPHFFCSDISAFGSLQGKRLSTNPLTAQGDDCLPVL